MKNLNLIEKEIAYSETEKEDYIDEIDFNSYCTLSPRTQLLLFITCKRGTLEQLKELHKTYNVDFNFSRGICLNIAVEHKQEDIAVYLLKNGVNNRRCLESALCFAASYGLDNIIDLILDKIKMKDSVYIKDGVILSFTYNEAKTFTYLLKKGIPFKSRDLEVLKEAVEKKYLTIDEYYKLFLEDEIKYYKSHIK